MRRWKGHHRLGGLLLAQQARFWWRLRAGMSVVAAVVVLAGLGSLAQSALRGEVAESVRKSGWILGALLMSVVLYRLMSLADLVAQLRERIARQNHRIHVLEAALERGVGGVTEAFRLGLTSATVADSCLIRLDAAVNEDPQGSAAVAIPDERLLSAPAGMAAHDPPMPHAQEDIAASNPSPDGALAAMRMEFRAALADDNLIEALRIGRALRANFTASRAAREFDQIEAVLLRRISRLDLQRARMARAASTQRGA